MPSFEEELDDSSGLGGILSFFSNLINSNVHERKMSVVKDGHLLHKLKNAIQKFERLIRIFELTYLDYST